MVGSLRLVAKRKLFFSANPKSKNVLKVSSEMQGKVYFFILGEPAPDGATDISNYIEKHKTLFRGAKF